MEYWLARDLQQLLGYAGWRNFNQTAISKAKVVCEVSGHAVLDHFVDINKMIQLAKGAEREIDDSMLTRYACYLIAQNGDTCKQSFAVIRSKGGQALFGKSTQAMKAQWQVPESRPLSDFAPTIILKAKDFATEITIHNARTHSMSNEPEISREQVVKIRLFVTRSLAVASARKACLRPRM